MGHVTLFFKSSLALTLILTNFQLLDAATRTWLGPTDMNAAASWSPAFVPIAGDEALFDSSNANLSPSLTAATFNVDLITFTGASQYTFSINTASMFNLVGSTLNPAGVQNTSAPAIAQRFNATTASIINFFNSTSADITGTGLVNYNLNASTLNFLHSSAASAAVISAVSGSSVTFSNSSTATTNTKVTLNTASTLSTDHSITIGSVDVTDAASQIQINGVSALSIGDSGNHTINGTITGTGALQKVGTGTQTLTNTGNTYSNGTTITAGTLLFSNSVPPPAGTLSIAAGANADFEVTAGSQTYSQPITGSGNVLVNQLVGSVGTLTLSGIKSYTGSTDVGGGTLILSNSANTILPGQILVDTGAAIDFEQAPNTMGTYSGALTGVGISVLVNQNPANSGTVALTNSSTSYTGTTTVSNGILQLVNLGTFPNDITNNAAVDYESTLPFTYSGVVSGNGDVTVNEAGSTGTVTFTNTNTYTGLTTVANGTLLLEQVLIPGDAVVASGANLDFELTAGLETYTGAISGAGNVLVNQLAGNAGEVRFTNTSTNYTGTTNVGGGILDIVDFSLTGNIIDDGTIDFESSSTQIYSGTISGTGNVTINNLGNLGTVEFTGPLTYTGTTSIVNGELEIISSGAVIAATSAINVAFLTTLDIEKPSGVGTYNGVITGGGLVNINTEPGSTGIVIFGNGTSNYTNITTVAGGVLEVISSNPIISTSSGYVVNSGAILDFEQTSGTGLYNDGPISGAGSFAVNTAPGSVGTVILTQPFYTGPTLIAGGTLEFQSIVPSTSSITLINNSTVNFSLTGDYPGGINGEGNLIADPGIGNNFILSGLSGTAYTGTTTVDSGTLFIENSSPTTTLAGNMILNGNLDLEQAPNTVGNYNGNISGTGSVAVNSIPGDTGTVVFTGLNSYTGGTTVSSGTLQGNTLSLQGSIVDNGTVTFDQFFDGTFNGTISGFGVMNKTGIGPLRITTNNGAFFGTTNVQQGRFVLTNLLGGNVDVLSEGILAGNGTVVGDVTIETGGRLSPGDLGSIEAFHVDGNYTQNGTYDVKVIGDQNTQLFVGGTATLNSGSTLNVIAPTTNVKIEEPYTILTANGGLSGTFSNVLIANPFLAAFVTYDPNHAFLEFQIQFGLIAKTFNQMQVANQLSTITNPTPEEEAILQALISLSELDAQHALDQMSGVQYTNLLLTAEVSNRQFIRRLYEPLRSIITSSPCPKTSCCVFNEGLPTLDIWTEVSGGKAFFQGGKNARGLRMSDFEWTLGAQANFNGELCGQYYDFVVGVAGSYEVDHISYRVGGSGKSRFGLGALYGLYRGQGFYFLTDLVAGHRGETMNRPINIGDLHFKAHGKPKIWETTWYAELGQDYCFNRMLIQPFVGVEVGRYWFNGISESGASPLNLTVNKFSHTLAYSRLGIHFTTRELPCRLSMGADLAWQYRFSSQGDHIRVHFQDFGDVFSIRGLRLQRNSVDAAVRVMQGLGSGWEWFAEMNGQSWQSAFSYGFLIGLKTVW